jgi:hypothetical protein
MKTTLFLSWFCIAAFSAFALALVLDLPAAAVLAPLVLGVIAQAILIAWQDYARATRVAAYNAAVYAERLPLAV